MKRRVRLAILDGLPMAAIATLTVAGLSSLPERYPEGLACAGVFTADTLGLCAVGLLLVGASLVLAFGRS